MRHSLLAISAKTLVFMLVAFIGANAYAIEPYTCRNGLFPSYEGDFELSAVVSTDQKPIHFHDDDKACPEGTSCIKKAYVVQGDTLLVAQKQAGWVCAWYFGRKSEYVGWLPAANIKPVLPKQIPSLQDWVGLWVPIAGSDQIRIRLSKKPGEIDLKGYAVWNGGKDDDGNEIANVGDFENTATPTGSRLTVGGSKSKNPYGCIVHLQLVSGNLIVTDDGDCGGMNVRFDDVYRKRTDNQGKSKKAHSPT